MMTKREIQEAILDRVDAIGKSCNDWHMNYNDGTLRGLIWALTGKDPHPINFGTTSEEIFTLADIPHWREGDRVHYDLNKKHAA